MAQTGYTPILIYSSSTVSQAPSAGNLTNSTLGSELAINITDGKLFYKDNANAVQVIAWKTTPTTAGGTGLTSYTAGDLLYYASGTTLSKLAIGTSGRWLGSSGSAPQWNSPAALTKTDDTNVTLTLGGSASTALLNAASLTLGWTGQLAVTRGGTGLASVAQGDILYGSAANTLSALAKNTTASRYLSNGGTSNNPAWAQVDLTNGVTGTLPTGNGGTGLSSYSAGDISYYASGTALSKLGIGASNTVMTSSGTAPQWSTALTLSGNVSAAALIPSSSTVPTNGVYYPTTNVVGFATNSTYAGRFDATQNFLVGLTAKNGDLGTSTRASIQGDLSATSSNHAASLGSTGNNGVSSTFDTKININQYTNGATALLLVSRNTSSGTATESAVYIVRFYYDGNNTPTTTYVGGSSNFVTFGASVGNTLTITDTSGGGVAASWFMNK